MRRLGERKATCVVTLETWNYHGQVRIMAVSGLPFLSFFANTSVLVLKTLHPPCARAKLKWSCPASTLDWTRRDVAREELTGKRGKRQERQKVRNLFPLFKMQGRQSRTGMIKHGSCGRMRKVYNQVVNPKSL